MGMKNEHGLCMEEPCASARRSSLKSPADHDWGRGGVSGGVDAVVAGVTAGLDVSVEYVTDAGSHNGYGYSSDEVSANAAASWDYANREPASEVTWSVVDDQEEEEMEVSMPVSQFARLLYKAKKWDAYLVDGCGCDCSCDDVSSA